MGRRRYLDGSCIFGSMWVKMLSIVIGSCLMVGCKKEIDTSCNKPSGFNVRYHEWMEPLPYLPAFPGSWWHYTDGSTITTGEEYVLSPILGTQWDPNHGSKYCCIETMAYMPIYDGRPLCQYSRMNIDASNSNNEICCEKLLSEQIGEIFHWGGSHYGRITSKIHAVDTTITLSNGTTHSPCIVVIRDLTFPYSDPSVSEYYEVYARNVGLIKLGDLAGLTH